LLSKRSIRTQFLIQLIVASAALLLIFSSFLYLYIQESIYDEKRTELLEVAKNVNDYESLFSSEANNSDTLLAVSVEMVSAREAAKLEQFSLSATNGHVYLVLIHPFKREKGQFLKISRDITTTKNLLDKILNSIFIINAIGFIVIIIYAIGLSKMLISPVMTLSRRLANMNEHLMRPVKVDELPDEFAPLGETLNHLIGRIQTFVKYQKELFIGAAHELKTPLAVMKLKNQVTLIKKRNPEEYIDAIKTTNTTIDEMNKIVADILNIGRQEGAQLELPVETDVIEYLSKKGNDYRLLAENEQKGLHIDLEPPIFIATIQISLLNQIIQNFVQNALKFTPQGKAVTLKSSLTASGLLIEVIDEGCGIDETVDLFAPFKRQGNKSGAGLGLFLAKSAADALGADIALKNRTDGLDGTVASLHLNTKLYCPLPSR
jgi:two-component system OmpR family sensor kinase